MKNELQISETEPKSQLVEFTHTIEELMKNDNKIIIMTADLVGSCKLTSIEKKYPDRFLNMGIAEQNMVSMAAGLAKEGFKPFIFSFSIFLSLRCCEQVRTDIFYNGLNVKIIGTHSGISTGPAGPTHYSLEDIGVIRAVPQSRIVVPADAVSACKFAHILADSDYPVYFRLDRNPLPVLYAEEAAFVIGEASVLLDGDDIVLFATGVMVSKAVEISNRIKNLFGINAAVIDIHTIKPFDYMTAGAYVSKCNYAFSIEEHNIFGGLGDAVAEVIATTAATCKLKKIGINDCYPMGGPVEDNREKLGLSTDKIFENIVNTINLKESN